MQNLILNEYQKSGIFGLISYIARNQEEDENPRSTAYNLLKFGLNISKKSTDKRLLLLPDIAFDLSRHESIYRIAGLLYGELEEYEKALECLSYLYFFYQEKELTPHNQYQLIKDQLIEHYGSISEVDSKIERNENLYQEQRILSHIKEYPNLLSVDDIGEQKEYFKRVYRRYGKETLLKAIETDVRFNNREKAVLLIRASRTIGAIAEEGPSIETLFANKALKLDNSDTVVKNSYQAYLRAGDLNNITQLKDQYPEILQTS